MSLQKDITAMGIFSEAAAASRAEILANILIGAATDPRWNDCRSAVMGFARAVILPLYESELADAFMDADPEVKRLYT